LDYIISETFIKDFSGDLYGKEIKIAFTEFLREERKFSSKEDLKIQVLSDIEKI
jgi:riboflavin kinase/FMN adenylyltransferase